MGTYCIERAFGQCTTPYPVCTDQLDMLPDYNGRTLPWLWRYTRWTRWIATEAEYNTLFEDDDEFSWRIATKHDTGEDPGDYSPVEPQPAEWCESGYTIDIMITGMPKRTRAVKVCSDSSSSMSSTSSSPCAASCTDCYAEYDSDVWYSEPGTECKDAIWNPWTDIRPPEPAVPEDDIQ